MSVSLWLDRPYTPRPALEGSARADVAILGGGLTGAAAAWFLAGRGVRVALLERGVVGGGASGRNAGFILAGGPSYSVSCRSHGRERARAVRQVALDNHRLLRDIVDAEKIDCGYAPSGSLLLALSENEADQLGRSAKMMSQDGFRSELLDDTDVARRFPGGGFKAGLFLPDDGEVDPVRLVRGIADAAERRGARIFEGTAATGLETRPDGVTVASAEGRLDATMLLLATNAWTPLVHPFFEAAIVGMRGQMLATAPLSRRLIPCPVYADFGFEYVRQLPDGRIVAGGGRRAALDAELTYAEKPTEPVQAAIERFLYSAFPEARDVPITHRWGGIMGFSCDELPAIGVVPSQVNVYVAAGYHGHGLGLAVAAAHAVSQMMVDGRSPFPEGLFSPARHLDA
ncbi:MAG TPA: FAD-dependent oxidoreductase [Planctomycetota bacterium]|nr:FAD-dependent oxidoreductase [Planctomycetota bacterium]